MIIQCLLLSSWPPLGCHNSLYLIYSFLRVFFSWAFGCGRQNSKDVSTPRFLLFDYSNTHLGTIVKGSCRYNPSSKSVALKIRRLSTWPDPIKWVLWKQGFLQLGYRKGNQRDSKCQKEFTHQCWFKDGVESRVVVRTNVGSLYLLREAPDQQPARKCGPQSYSPVAVVEFFQQLQWV